MAFDGRVLEFIVVVPARLVGGVKAGSLVGADVKVAIVQGATQARLQLILFAVRRHAPIDVREVKRARVGVDGGVFLAEARLAFGTPVEGTDIFAVRDLAAREPLVVESFIFGNRRQIGGVRGKRCDRTRVDVKGLDS